MNRPVEHEDIELWEYSSEQDEYIDFLEGILGGRMIARSSKPVYRDEMLTYDLGEEE